MAHTAMCYSWDTHGATHKLPTGLDAAASKRQISQIVEGFNPTHPTACRGVPSSLTKDAHFWHFLYMYFSAHFSSWVFCGKSPTGVPYRVTH